MYRYKCVNAGTVSFLPVRLQLKSVLKSLCSHSCVQIKYKISSGSEIAMADEMIMKIEKPNPTAEQIEKEWGLL